MLRDSSEKSPCANCGPAASGLSFRLPGCEPKPVRFFNRSSECRSHAPRLQREIAVRKLRASRIWLEFSPPRVRTKTCPLFQSLVRMPLAYSATPARNRRAQTCGPAASGLSFRLPGCEPKPVRFFNRSSECRLHTPRLQREIAVRKLRASRIWLGFLPPRVRTKTCPLFSPTRWRHPIQP